VNPFLTAVPRQRITEAGVAPAPGMVWALVGVACLGGLPHLVRMALAGFPALAEADTLRALLAPPLFVAIVAMLAFLAARQTWGWPIDRAVAMRWLSEGATFAVASTTLFLLLDSRAEFGRAAWLHRTAERMAGIVWPALSEELAYRGILTAVVSSSLASIDGGRARAAWTILSCSAAFSVAHEFAPSIGAFPANLVRRFVAGVVLGALAWRSRSLLPPMFAHAAFNALTRAG
jgi:membrane protease YdiL (CAAX protease family)